MESYVYNCNRKNYVDLVNQLDKKYSDDLERLEAAEKLMNKQQYHHYLISTLQQKSFDHMCKNGRESSITLRVSDIDDFLRSVLWLSDHIEKEVDFGYVRSKRKFFIESLIEQLY